MAQWIVCRETPIGSNIYLPVDFLAAAPDSGGGTAWLQSGQAIYDDGFPNDFSGWGDDEGRTINDFMVKLSEADGGISYGCYWVGPDFVANPDGEGLRAAGEASPSHPAFITMLPPKRGGRPPKKPKK